MTSNISPFSPHFLYLNVTTNFLIMIFNNFFLTCHRVKLRYTQVEEWSRIDPGVKVTICYVWISSMIVRSTMHIRIVPWCSLNSSHLLTLYYSIMLIVILCFVSIHLNLTVDLYLLCNSMTKFHFLVTIKNANKENLDMQKKVIYPPEY